MTGKSVSTAVDRAFRILGGLFLFGGVYMGTLMFLDAPEVFQIDGTISDMRVEKQRPLGFEHVPVDTTDPEYTNIPLNINTYAKVNYTWQGMELEGDIVSWSDTNDWNAGMEIPLYLVSGEEDIPLDYFPAEAADAKKNALIVGIAMTVAGLILFIFGTVAPGVKVRQDKELLEKIRKLKNREWHPPRIPSSTVLCKNVHKGNWLLGGILSFLGIILLVSMILQFIRPDDMGINLFLVFPLFLGVGILYLGSWEFFREEVTVTNSKVKVCYRSLWTNYEETLPLSTFGGIREIRLEERNSSLASRRIFREFVLLHPDSRFHELCIKKVSENEKAESEGTELSAKLGLPRIIFEGDKILLNYSE